MWYLELAPATPRVFDPLWAAIRSSGRSLLLTKETTILKTSKRKNNPGVHPCITATEGWADTAGWRFKASERRLGHLAVSIVPWTRSALFLKCCLFVFFFSKRSGFDFILFLMENGSPGSSSTGMGTLAFEPEFHLILNPGGGQESVKNFLSLTFKGPNMTPFGKREPLSICSKPTPDQLYSIIFLARSSAPLALLLLGANAVRLFGHHFGSVHLTSLHWEAFFQRASRCQSLFLLRTQVDNLEETLLLVLIHLAMFSMICMYPSLFPFFFLTLTLSNRHEKKTLQ